LASYAVEVESRSVASLSVAFDELDDEIVGCRRCERLVAWREEVAAAPRASYAGQEYWARPITGFGDRGAWLCIVGLAPAAHGGNRTGRVFTGDRSGDWLFAALWRAGLANQPLSVDRADGLHLEGAYVTAAVRCAPPQNHPTPDERRSCLGYLERELELLTGVRVVVALGELAYKTVSGLYGLRPRPRFGHGVEARAADGTYIVCSYHPSQQNTFTGKLTEPMFDAVFDRARTLGDVGSGPG
jgi:uracil-DNA glycosylase family 4